MRLENRTEARFSTFSANRCDWISISCSEMSWTYWLFCTFRTLNITLRISLSKHCHTVQLWLLFKNVISFCLNSIVEQYVIIANLGTLIWATRTRYNVCSEFVNSFARRQHLNDIAAKSVTSIWEIVNFVSYPEPAPCSCSKFSENIKLEGGMGGAAARPGPSSLYQMKCNIPPINAQCTNFVLFDAPL